MNDEYNLNELRRLDLNLLLVFAALMREGGVTPAARRLFVGPSAVSMSLSRLRALLDDQLFVRTGRAMTPTPRADALWREVEPALAMIDGAIRPQAFDPATSDATFRLAAPDDLDLALVPTIAERLATAAPLARLSIMPADYLNMFDLVQEGQADCALSALPDRLPPPSVRTSVLWRERFLALFDPGQFAGADRLSLDVFAEAAHVLRTVSGDMRGPIDRALATHGLERRVGAAVGSFPTIPFLLRSSAMVASVPAIAARHMSEAFDLASAELPVPSPTFEVALAWPARLDADPAAKWFRSLVVACAHDIAARYGE